MSTKFLFGKGRGNLFVPKPKTNDIGVILENELVVDENIDLDFGYQYDQDDQMLDDLSTSEKSLLEATDFQELDSEPQLQEAKE